MGVIKRPYGFWNVIQNRIDFLDDVAKQLNVKTVNDWKTVRIKDVVKLGGYGLTDRYSNSLYRILSDTYQNVDWKPEDFGIFDEVFDSTTKQRERFDQLMIQLEIKSMRDWNQISVRNMSKYEDVRYILKKYDNVLLNALKAIYPDEDWSNFHLETRNIPKGYWDSVILQREMMSRLEKALDIKEILDWKRISSEQIREAGGGQLLRKYGNSLHKLLQGVYPDIEWDPTEMKRVPRHFWSNIQNQRDFFIFLETKLGIRDKQDWTSITKDTVVELGGSSILAIYNGSLIATLQAIYPDHPWSPTQFPTMANKMRTGHWNNIENQRSFLETFRKKFNLNTKRDWSKISMKQIEKEGGRGILYHYDGSLYKTIQKVFPELDWTGDKEVDWGSNLSKSHQKIYDMLKVYIRDLEVNSRSSGIERQTGTLLEFDLWSPSLKLALEFHGKQHYEEGWKHHSLKQQQESDEEKRILCEKNEVTLIEVPYWWDGKESSLISMILKKRPELETTIFPKNSKNQVLEQDVSFSLDKEVGKIPEGFALGTNYTEETDPTGWIMSEKFDGIRAIWNGIDFYSRQMNVLKAPSSFKMQMPAFSLDGELWISRNSFQLCNDVVMSSANNKLWSDVIYKVFDAPSLASQNYEERIEFLNKNVGSFYPNVEVVEFKKCEGREHLMKELDQIIQSRGEGIVLRKADSKYEIGRSDNFLKVKKKFTDEAIIVDIADLTHVKLLNSFGVEFTIHVSKTDAADYNLRNGSIVSYSFFGLTRNLIPRYPSFSTNTERNPIDNSTSKQLSVFKDEIISTNTASIIPFRLQLHHLLAKCRGCGISIGSSNSLRILVKTLFFGRTGRHGGQEPQLVHSSFCPRFKCLFDSMERDKKYGQMIYPAFQNQILVSDDVVNTLQKTTDEAIISQIKLFTDDLVANGCKLVIK